MLEKIHQGHQRIQRCCLQASISVWWPGLSSQIDKLVHNCPHCAKYRAPRKEPLMLSTLPDYPWQKIGTDLFVLNGTTYLLAVDYFSRYPKVVKLTSLTSQSVMTTLKSLFSRFGVPQEVMSDNGLHYGSQEFADFATFYAFLHTTSSPYLLTTEQWACQVSSPNC